MGVSSYVAVLILLVIRLLLLRSSLLARPNRKRPLEATDPSRSWKRLLFTSFGTEVLGLPQLRRPRQYHSHTSDQSQQTLMS